MICLCNGNLGDTQKLYPLNSNNTQKSKKEEEKKTEEKQGAFSLSLKPGTLKDIHKNTKRLHLFYFILSLSLSECHLKDERMGREIGDLGY